MSDQFLTVTLVARILNKSSDAVRLYERKGLLPAIRAGGIRIFRIEDVLKFKAAQDAKV